MQSPILVLYRSVDHERVFDCIRGIDENVGKELCFAVASDTVTDDKLYFDLIQQSKVFLLVYSSNYALIETTEYNRIRKMLELIASHVDKRIAIISLDSDIVPDWLEEILPRQQVTFLSNSLSVDVLYKTLKERVIDNNLQRINALPKGIFKVGDLFYRATQDGDVVEVSSESGDYNPEFRCFGNDIPELIIPQTIQYAGYEYEVIGIGESAFRNSYGYKSVIIPPTVKYIKGTAFADSSIVSIVIPDSVTEIGEWAFDCSRLAEIKLSKNIRHLRKCLFKDCSSLASLILPKGLKQIEDSIFSGCGIGSITIPDTVVNIGSGVFRDSSIATIVVDKENPKYDNRENCGAIIETATDTLIAAGSNSTIPNSVKCIGSNVLSFDKNIKSLVVPNGVLLIKECAYSISSIESVIIPDSVLVIEDEAFAYCDNLHTVTLGRNIAKIGRNVFWNLSHYNNYNIECLPMVYVPKGLKDKYMKLLHTDFASRIIEIEE